jgi:CubicO group peptidase (beta-lactamase class C family)
MGACVWSETEALLSDALEEGIIPGLAVCVHDGQQTLWEFAGGSAELRPTHRPARTDTSWDLASLTKVLCTVPLVISLIEEGRMELDSDLSEVIEGAPQGVSVAHCLQHSSGWPAWRPFFTDLGIDSSAWGKDSTRQAVLSGILQTPLQTRPGERHCYSDLGMIALGFALERWGGAPLDVLFEERISGPARLSLGWGDPQAAATEDCPLRGRVIRGQVHDLNAAMLGGISAHAGLFGSAAAVAAAVATQLRSWHGEGAYSTELVREFWSRVGPGSHRLGWDSPSGTASSASALWPRDGVGHLGFTGCSIWVAPADSLIVVFCSNRVHPMIEGGAVPDAPPGPLTRAFKGLRPRIHSSVLRAMSAS